MIVSIAETAGTSQDKIGLNQQETVKTILPKPHIVGEAKVLTIFLSSYL